MARDYSKKEVRGTVSKIKSFRETKNSHVLNFSVATNRSFKDQNDEWAQGPTLWTEVTVWGNEAVKAHDSLRPGDRVVVSGEERMSDGFTNDEGKEFPPRPFLNADSVSLSLDKDSAKSDRVPKDKDNDSKKSNSSSKSKKAEKPEKTEKKSDPLDDDDFDLDDFDVDDLDSLDDEPPV